MTLAFLATADVKHRSSFDRDSVNTGWENVELLILLRKLDSAINSTLKIHILAENSNAL